MAQFSDLLAEVMDLAPSFSPQTNPAMRRRKAALKELAATASGWVRNWQPKVASDLQLGAEDGGQVGAVSPIGWMRVYSKTKSPSATAGFYIVYLFDALGDRVFLSLNQGTSEYRAGQWRPVSDSQKVADNAAAARFALDHAGAEMDWGSSERIDLRVQGLRDAGLFTSRDPVDRARNYELGNVLAKAYGRDALPSDEALRDDLLRAVSTLLALHDVSLEDSAAPESAPRIPRRGLGRLSGPERRAVEARSMEVTREYYKAGGWTVEDVSAFRPYDYECTKDGLALHVEVKGSTASDIRQIELTRNEVDHCRSYPAMGLALVSGIRLETGGSGLPVGEGGVLSFVIPWSIEDARLTPLAFAYELPATRVTEELSRTSG